MMSNLVKTFDPNLVGRDFVIGDLHGSFPCFLRLLEGISFDPSKDRMFSCGDLVDRGPASLQCLELLREPWFHAVLANHELMMLESFTSKEHATAYATMWMRSGGTWAIEALNVAASLARKSADNSLPNPLISEDDYETIDLQSLVAELPYLITVNTKSGKKFHIIHAELPPTKEPITDEHLADPDQLQKLIDIECEDGSHMLWGRSIFMTIMYHSHHLKKACRSLAYAHKIGEVPLHFDDRLSHVISGHTPLMSPTTVAGRTCIDTGAFKSLRPSNPDKRHYLTCVELDTWQFYKATADEFCKIEPVVIKKEDIFKVHPDDSDV